MTIQSREIRQAPRAQRMTFAEARYRLLWVALIGTMLMSYTATAAFVVAALRPATPVAWMFAIGIGIVFEALLIVAKLALRDNSRDSLGWGASLLDMATNTAGVYWWAPGLPTVPGISDALTALAIDPAGGLARVLVSALVGAFLSAAPVWLLPLALEGRDGG